VKKATEITEQEAKKRKYRKGQIWEKVQGIDEPVNV